MLAPVVSSRAAKDAFMAANYPDYVATANWVDLITLPAYAALANQLVTVQAKGAGSSGILHFSGGAAAPAGDNGNLLVANQSVPGTTDHIWIKGSGRVAIRLED